MAVNSLKPRWLSTQNGLWQTRVHSPITHFMLVLATGHQREDPDQVTALAYIVTGEKDRANFRTGQM